MTMSKGFAEILSKIQRCGVSITTFAYGFFVSHSVGQILINTYTYNYTSTRVFSKGAVSLLRNDSIFVEFEAIALDGAVEAKEVR